MMMTVLLAGETNRHRPSTLPEPGRGSLHPARLLTAFVANLYGTDGPLADFWGQPSFAWGPTDLFLARNMSDVYIGRDSAPCVTGAGRCARSNRPLARSASLCGALAAADDLRARALHAGFRADVPSARHRSFPPPGGCDLPDGGAWRRHSGGLLRSIACSGEPAGSGAPPFLRRRALMAGGLCSVRRCRHLERSGLGQAAAAARAVALPSPRPRAWRWAPHGWQGKPALAGGRAPGRGADGGPRAEQRPDESTALPPAMYDVLRPDSRNTPMAFLRGAARRDERRPTRPDRNRRGRLPLAQRQHDPPARQHAGLQPCPARSTTARATGAQDHVALPDQRSFAPLMPAYRSLLADMLGLRCIATRGEVADDGKPSP